MSSVAQLPKQGWFPPKVAVDDRGDLHAAEDADGNRRVALLIVAATLLALAVRIVWWLIAQSEPVADYLGYRSMAERLITDGTFIRDGVPTAWRVPGYPTFLGVSMLISRSDQWLSFVNVLLSTTVIPLTALVARGLRLPARVVVVAALTAALMPPLVLWAPVMGSENLQLPLLLGAIALALTRRSSGWSKVGCGLLFGVAVLVRPESLFYLAAVPVLIWSTGVSARRALTGAAGAAVVAACVVAPWYLRNETVVGRGVGLSSTGGMNFYLAHRADGYGFVDPEQTPLAGLAEVELTETGYRLGWEHLANDPAALIGDVARGTIELYRPPSYAAFYSTRERGHHPFPASVDPGVHGMARGYAVIGWVIVAGLAVVGLVRLRSQPRTLAALATIILANWLCFAVIFWAMPRYRLSIEPLLCIAAAVALASRPSSAADGRVDEIVAAEPSNGRAL